MPMPRITRLKHLVVSVIANIKQLSVGTVNAPGSGNLSVENDVTVGKDLHVENDLTVEGQIIAPAMEVGPRNRAYFTFLREGELNTNDWLLPGSSQYDPQGWVGYPWTSSHIVGIPMLRPGQITGLSVSMVSVYEPAPPQSVEFHAGFTYPPPHRGPSPGIAVEGAHPDGTMSMSPFSKLTVEVDMRKPGNTTGGPPDEYVANFGRTSNWATSPMSDDTDQYEFAAGSYIRVKVHPHQNVGEGIYIKNVIAVVEVTYIT